MLFLLSLCNWLRKYLTPFQYAAVLSDYRTENHFLYEVKLPQELFFAHFLFLFCTSNIYAPLPPAEIQSYLDDIAIWTSHALTSHPMESTDSKLTPIKSPMASVGTSTKIVIITNKLKTFQSCLKLISPLSLTKPQIPQLIQELTRFRS